MNVWSSAPSPPFDALGAPSTTTSSALLAAWHIALALPRRIWDAYVAYLCYYEPHSWVGRVASTFRILATALVLPVVLLTLLDVTSYVIARTLGIVDDIKASTSDALEPGTHASTADDGRRVRVVAVAASAPSDPAARAYAAVGTPVRTSEGLAPEDSIGGDDGDGHGCVGAAVRVASRCSSRGAVVAAQAERGVRARTPQTYYFVGEGPLGLAGEGVFSPAVSGPPSPLTPCMQLRMPSDDGAKASGEVVEEAALRRRLQGVREDESVHT